MERIKSISLKYHIPTIIGIMFLLFSCTKDEILNDGQEMNNTIFTDEEVFKGVMFLEGPVANKMNDFKDLNFRSFVTDKSQIEEIINFQNEIINRLKTLDPNFLSNFRKNIGSSDYYLVKSTTAIASRKIANIAFEIASLSKEDVSKIAKNFTSSLTEEYHIDENSSKEDLIKVIKSMKTKKQNAKDVYPVYYYKYAAVWLAAAAIIIIVMIIPPLYEVPIDPNDSFPLEPEDPNDLFFEESNDHTNFEKKYFMESYQSEITFELKGI